MIKAKDLRKLLCRVEGLYYRLHDINDVKINKFTQGDCIRIKRALEEAGRASVDRSQGHERQAKRPYITGCNVLFGLVKTIISTEKELQGMVQNRLELIEKRLNELERL